MKIRLISFASEIKVSKPSKNNKNASEESAYNLSAESKEWGRFWLCYSYWNHSVSRADLIYCPRYYLCQ